MENAAQTLGRLRAIAGVDADAVTIDLRAANLQGIDFEGGNFNRRAAGGCAVAGGKAPAGADAGGKPRTRRCRGQTCVTRKCRGQTCGRANAGGNPRARECRGQPVRAQMQGAT